jgi:putative nucleotidyltransferase with HDIG domain
MISDSLRLSNKDKHYLIVAAILHDLGKVNIPLEILDSPRSLQYHEWMIIKQHPSYGADMLRNCHFHSHIIDGIQSHHEWYDGSGYPSNLKGEAIPWQGRIIAIADSLDAMISYRPYKSPKTPVLKLGLEFKNYFLIISVSIWNILVVCSYFYGVYPVL